MQLFQTSFPVEYCEQRGQASLLGWRAEGELGVVPSFLIIISSPLGFPWVNIRLGQEGECGDSFGNYVYHLICANCCFVETCDGEIQMFISSCYRSSFKRCHQPALLDPPTFIIVGKHFEKVSTCPFLTQSKGSPRN